MKDSFCAGDLLEDVVGFCGPDEGLGVLVVSVDVLTDSHDELLEVLENASPDSLVGQIAEEARSCHSRNGRQD